MISLKCLIGKHKLRPLVKIETKERVSITYWGGKKDEMAMDIETQFCTICRQIFVD